MPGNKLIMISPIIRNDFTDSKKIIQIDFLNIIILNFNISIVANSKLNKSVKSHRCNH